MKNKHSIASFLSGAFVTLLLIGLILPATAVSSGKTVTIYPGVNIYVDDQKLNPKDVNGNPVEVFIYNGSTYLPVRAVSEALGKPVQWEGSTSSVYIGKHSSDKPAAWLSDLDYFDGEYWWDENLQIDDNWGNIHEHTLSPRGNESTYRIYNLNGQYSAISGVFFQRFYTRSEHYENYLRIYGDDVLLWDAEMSAGVDPKEFKVDVSGVLKLKIEMKNGYYVALGEVALWT